MEEKRKSQILKMEKLQQILPNQNNSTEDESNEEDEEDFMMDVADNYTNIFYKTKSEITN